MYSSLGFEVSFGGSSLLCRIYGVGVPYVELESLTPQGNNPYPFVIPPVGGLLSLEFFLGEHISYSSRCGPFACGCGSCVHTLFRFISMGNFPHIVSALLCLREEVSSGSSYITILNCLPSVFLSYCLYFCFYSLGFIFHVTDQMTVVSYEFHPSPNPNSSKIL